jgi:choline kinase
MKAIIPAAGVGRRLGTFSDRHPKSLLRFGSETLLQRHLRHLSSLRIEEITVVVGHLATQIEAEIARVGCSVPVRVVANPLYRMGSAYSVLAASDALASGPCLLMDADLLYERELLERVLRDGSPNCLLVDSKLEDSGEEVKVVARADGRACELGKSVRAEAHVVGESVGIFKFDTAAGRRLVARLRAVAEADPYAEYELAIDDLVKECEVVCVSADGLAWIEIDFPEDAERARTQIYPRMIAAGTL